MSKRISLISFLYDNIRKEGKTILKAGAASGLQSVNEQIKESAGNPETPLTFGHILDALKTGMVSASQQVMVSTLDRLNERVSAEEKSPS